MTEREKIKKEIERRLDLYSIAEKDDSIFARMGELSSLIDFIDSLPEEHTDEANCTTENEDLNEELHSWMRENCDDNGFFNQFELARHFAEWQREKNKQLVGATQKISYQHGYDEGRLDMKEELMKDAINGIMDCYDDNEWIEITDTDKLIVTPSIAGKKVKFIIVKEEQQ